MDVSLILISLKMWFSVIAFLCPLAIGSVIPESSIAGPHRAAAACQFRPYNTLPTPLLIRSNQLVYPPSAGDTTISLGAGETIDLACPGGHILTDGTSINKVVVTASCITGSTLAFNNSRFTWRRISCSSNPIRTSRYTGNTCAGNGREAEIGFMITNSRFVRTLLVCFDEANQTTIWSHYDLVSSINQQITGTPRPSFTQEPGFFKVSNVNQLYLRTAQRKTINNLLGLAASSTTYISNNNNSFLSRGHLTARADFFYPSGQNSTFDFLNALPQWQTFNSLNWETTESNVRDYAESKNVSLKVWTGGYGVTTLPHSKTGAQIPLYLSVNGNQRAIPVPEIYWKIVYNPVSQRGVALIGVNNPYKKISEIDKFCNDRSEVLPWLTWLKDEKTNGFSWACTVPAFRRIVTSAPNLQISGLLF